MLYYHRHRPVFVLTMSSLSLVQSLLPNPQPTLVCDEDIDTACFRLWGDPAESGDQQRRRNMIRHIPVVNRTHLQFLLRNATGQHNMEWRDAPGRWTGLAKEQAVSILFDDLIDF